MIEVKIVESISTDDFRIWIYERRYPRIVAFFRPTDKYGGEWKELDAGEPMPEEYSMRIPIQVLHTLVSAVNHIPIPSESMYAHLVDAIKMRDRLLTILEKHAGIYSGQPSGVETRPPSR